MRELYYSSHSPEHEAGGVIHAFLVDALGILLNEFIPISYLDPLHFGFDDDTIERLK